MKINIKNILHFFNTHRENFFLLFILIIASCFRLYNFPHRWGLGGDDMRDIAIAKEALLRKELPLIGSFSSAGPFVFGPLFYWFIMISYLIFPVLTGPWIMLTLVGILTTYIIVECGKVLGGTRMSIIAGIMAATSPQLIARSIALNQHSLIAITTSLVILNYVLYWQKKKLIYAFFAGLSLGIALSMHYQAINLLIFLPAIFFVPEIKIQKRIIGLIVMLIGLILPSLPILLWDSRQNFANIRNILDYFLIGQYRIYVPNSWKLFLFKYFPDYWLFVLGGHRYIAFFEILLVIYTFLLALIKKKISSIMVMLGSIFLTLSMLNKYYRGERFEGYLIYLAPFIIIFSAWALDILISKSQSRYVGYVLLALIIYGNVFLTTNHVVTGENHLARYENIRKILLNEYPNKKLSLYDFEWRSSDESYPVSALLKNSNKTDPNGVPIGFIWEAKKKYLLGGTIITSFDGNLIVDLTNDTSFNKNKANWIKVNQGDIYDSLMQWTTTRKLKSNFSFELFNFKI